MLLRFKNFIFFCTRWVRRATAGDNALVTSCSSDVQNPRETQILSWRNWSEHGNGRFNAQHMESWMSHLHCFLHLQGGPAHCTGRFNSQGMERWQQHVTVAINLTWVGGFILNQVAMSCNLSRDWPYVGLRIFQCIDNVFFNCISVVMSCNLSSHRCFDVAQILNIMSRGMELRDFPASFLVIFLWSMN